MTVKMMNVRYNEKHLYIFLTNHFGILKKRRLLA